MVASNAETWRLVARRSWAASGIETSDSEQESLVDPLRSSSGSPSLLLPSPSIRGTSNPSVAVHYGALVVGEVRWWRMAKAGGGMIWATAEYLVRNRPAVLSLYRQILRALDSPELPLGHAARLAKKAECRAIFIFGADERSLHNIRDLLDAARHTLGLLNGGRLP